MRKLIKYIDMHGWIRLPVLEVPTPVIPWALLMLLLILLMMPL